MRNNVQQIVSRNSEMDRNMYEVKSDWIWEGKV
jgi:hypothetical protein